jgi:hypothetical protein
MVRHSFQHLFRNSTLARSAVLGLALIAAAPVLMPQYAPQASAVTDPFSGSAYQLTVTPDSATLANGHDVFTEYVFFDSSGYTTKACAALGFAPTAYTFAPVTGGVKFTCTLVSNSQGTMVWTGTYMNGNISGTMVWTKGSETMNYSWTAQSYTPPPAE